MWRLLLPADFGASSRRALDAAAALAARTPVALTLLHVFDDRLADYVAGVEGASPTRVKIRLRDRARRALDALLADWSPEGPPLDVVFREGRPAETVVAHAEEQKFHCIVLGAPEARGGGRPTVADGVVARATVPVYVVRAPAPSAALR